MPVTAKLSRKFYERLGDEIANELVEWFNLIDETYRAELRELNDRNFSAFDARLGERLGELRSDLRGEIAAFRVELHAEIAALRAELHAEIAALRAELHTEIAALRAEVHTEIAALRTEMRTEIAGLRTDLHAFDASLARASVVQMRWLVGMWVAQMMALIGTILVVVQAR